MDHGFWEVDEFLNWLYLKALCWEYETYDRSIISSVTNKNAKHIKSILLYSKLIHLFEIRGFCWLTECKNWLNESITVRKTKKIYQGKFLHSVKLAPPREKILAKHAIIKSKNISIILSLLKKYSNNK